MTRGAIEVLYFNEGLLARASGGETIFIPATEEGMARLRQLAWNAAGRAGAAGGMTPPPRVEIPERKPRMFSAAGRELVPLEDL